jgi:hypothetical protein
LKKTNLLLFLLSISVVLTVLVHFSLSIGPTDSMTMSPHHRDGATNLGSTFDGSIENATDTKTGSSVSGQHSPVAREPFDMPPYRSEINSSVSSGQGLDSPNYENGLLPTPLPDGRIFAHGDLPYGYLPTCSPKDKGMPSIPVEPD